MIDHPQPVPKQRSAREGAGGVYGQDPDTLPLLPVLLNHLVDKSTLPGSDGPGNAYGAGSASPRVQVPDETTASFPTILNRRDGPGQGPVVALQHLRSKISQSRILTRK